MSRLLKIHAWVTLLLAVLFQYLPFISESLGVLPGYALFKKPLGLFRRVALAPSS